jgi:hypothetical protein
MAGRRWSPVRDDSNIDCLAVLSALYVPNIGLVPRCRELRESNRGDERRCEKSGRHTTLSG